MKIGYYILIFLLIGAVIGYIYGSSYQPNCPINPDTGIITECMGDPATYQNVGTIIGAIVGIILGAGVGWIVNSKKK